MTFRMERDCSLSSTQRIVLFGFIGLSKTRQSCGAKIFKEGIGLNARSELNPIDRASACKVTEKPMQNFLLAEMSRVCRTAFFAEMKCLAAKRIFLRVKLQQHFHRRVH